MIRLEDFTKGQQLELLKRFYRPVPPDLARGIDSTGFRYKCAMCRHPLGVKGRGHGGYMDYEQYCPRCAQLVGWQLRDVHPGWGEYTIIKEHGSIGYREKEED